jgi:CubicO group peptidase (beta-lactamase class C family)
MGCCGLGRPLMGLAILLAGFSPGNLPRALAAQAPLRFAARVDSLVRAEMARQALVGLSLAVIHRGRVVLERGWGFANLEHRVPATPETVYQSGSVGKQFTAAAIMLLAQEGRLGLDDPVTRFFPDAPDQWRGVTIRHLLTHTAGAGDYPDDFDFRRDYTEEQIRAIVLAQPLAFAPGSQWSYSNFGYVLLGTIIRQVTAKFYGDFLADRIFTPLGMTTARIIAEADIVPHRAAGYRREDGKLLNQEWVSPTINTTADGSLYLTVRDMARWDHALSGTDLLTRESMALIRAPVTLASGTTYPYGLGWRVGQAQGHAVMAHGGSWQGFKSYIVRYPEDGLTVVAFANLAQADPAAVAQGVAELWDATLLPLAAE